MLYSRHHSSQHLSCSRRKTLVVADSADAGRILPITRDGFGRCETNGAYRTMILHNCLSGHTARLALWEEQREASTPCCRRQAQLVRWPAKFVSALVMSVTRPLLIISSIFFDRTLTVQCAHTSSPRSCKRARQLQHSAGKVAAGTDFGRWALSQREP